MMWRKLNLCLPSNDKIQILTSSWPPPQNAIVTFLGKNICNRKTLYTPFVKKTSNNTNNMYVFPEGYCYLFIKGNRISSEIWRIFKHQVNNVLFYHDVLNINNNFTFEAN